MALQKVALKISLGTRIGPNRSMNFCSEGLQGLPTLTVFLLAFSFGGDSLLSPYQELTYFERSSLLLRDARPSAEREKFDP